MRTLYVLCSENMIFACSGQESIKLHKIIDEIW